MENQQGMIIIWCSISWLYTLWRIKWRLSFAHLWVVVETKSQKINLLGTNIVTFKRFTGAPVNIISHDQKSHSGVLFHGLPHSGLAIHWCWVISFFLIGEMSMHKIWNWRSTKVVFKSYSHSWRHISFTVDVRGNGICKANSIAPSWSVNFFVHKYLCNSDLIMVCSILLGSIHFSIFLCCGSRCSLFVYFIAIQ